MAFKDIGWGEWYVGKKEYDIVSLWLLVQVEKLLDKCDRIKQSSGYKLDVLQALVFSLFYNFLSAIGFKIVLFAGKGLMGRNLVWRVFGK